MHPLRYTVTLLYTYIYVAWLREGRWWTIMDALQLKRPLKAGGAEGKPVRSRRWRTVKTLYSGVRGFRVQIPVWAVTTSSLPLLIVSRRCAHHLVLSMWPQTDRDLDPVTTAMSLLSTTSSYLRVGVSVPQNSKPSGQRTLVFQSLFSSSTTLISEQHYQITSTRTGLLCTVYFTFILYIYFVL